MAQKYTYVPPKTGQAFHEAPLGTYLYKSIRGVPGSGKSVVCCWDIRLAAEKQPAFWDAKSEKMVRWSRWGVFRKTFPALKGTTIKTWMDWFSPFTTLHESPPLEGLFEAPSMHQDGSWVRIELKFLATDSPNFFDDLDSLELSGGYVNEAAQIELEKIHKIQERVGRFKPPGAAAAGLKFLAFGVIMDTNTPLETSWWYDLEQVKKPKRMLFFVQPPAMIRTKDKAGNVIYLRNDAENAAKYGTGGPCENVEHHNEGWDYYEKQLVGADEDYIKRRLLNQYGRSKGGLPVYSEYLDELHCTSDAMEITRENTLIGMDFGRNPAATLGKLGAMGQLRIHRECVRFNMGVPRFVDECLIPLLVNEFDWPNVPAVVFGDPAGMNPGEMSDIGPIPYLNAKGILCVVPECLQGKNNDVNIRLNAVSEMLRSNYKGTPDLLISSKCEYLRNGFNGDYHYKQMRTADGTQAKYNTDSPEKNEFSHVHDSLQYLCCGIRGGGSRFARGSVGMNVLPAFDATKCRTHVRCV